jgi:integrase
MGGNFYTGQSVGRLIDLRYTDIERGSAYLRVKGRIKAKRIELSAPVCAILERRRDVSSRCFCVSEPFKPR